MYLKSDKNDLKLGSVKEVLIRAARSDDAERIIQLLVELGRPKPRRIEVKLFEQLIDRYISDLDKEIFVAEIDSIIVGVVSIVFLPRLNRMAPEAWIPDLLVSRNYRGKGVGKALLEKCFDLARQKACWRVRLESGLSRRASHAFYRRMKMRAYAFSFMKAIQ